jgi:FkbM family methyltransferase
LPRRKAHEDRKDLFAHQAANVSLPGSQVKKTVMHLKKQTLIILLTVVTFLFREWTLALAKFALRFLPYGKAVAIASNLIRKFPTTDTTKRFYDSARPRWRRSFVFHLNPFCPLSKLFALTGLYQPEMTQELLRRGYQGTLVDIGANFGYFSVLWLSRRNGDALAIEPTRQNYELLVANLRDFGRRAKTLMCCLGERHGEVSMSYDPGYPMLSKISENCTLTQKVEMKTLVEVLEQEGLSHIDVLKCDAEGHDVSILSSAHELFEKGRIRVLFFESETWNQKCDSELNKFNQFLLKNRYRALPNKGDLCYSLEQS